jgi:alkylation response protein AidB-like acyl-CoA dehydrogenase
MSDLDGLLREIGAGAVERELNRELPFEAVERLRRAGFGALRVPREHGGGGLGLAEFVDVLIRLGRADSNLPQLLRGHIGFTELVLAGREHPERDFWLGQIAAGALVGNAQSERGAATVSTPGTRIEPVEGDGWVVHGRKYYSTGSLFADWIYLSGLSGENAPEGGRFTTAVVRADGPGVERLDDWDGFGQRLTGSGTTVLDGAPARYVEVVESGRWPVNTQQAVFQLVHLATLAGIAQRVEDDVVEFVRGRQRNGFLAAVDRPRDDPQVQQVVGEIAGLALAAAATTRAAALAVQAVQEAQERGTATAEDRHAADAAVFAAQPVVIDLTLRATTDLFRVGGASAVSRDLALDRHWRNARTVASHNPEIFRARVVGAHLLNGEPPGALPRPVPETPSRTGDPVPA